MAQSPLRRDLTQSPSNRAEFMAEAKEQFLKVATPDTERLPPDSFQPLLRQFGVYLLREQASELTREIVESTGGITFNEFIQLFEAANELTASEAEVMAEFARFDEHRTGFITADQFRSLLTTLAGVPESEVDDLLEAAKQDDTQQAEAEGEYAERVSYDFVVKLIKENLAA